MQDSEQFRELCKEQSHMRNEKYILDWDDPSIHPENERDLNLFIEKQTDTAQI